jgi:hypothetical protein
VGLSAVLLLLLLLLLSVEIMTELSSSSSVKSITPRLFLSPGVDESCRMNWRGLMHTDDEAGANAAVLEN